MGTILDGKINQVSIMAMLREKDLPVRSPNHAAADVISEIKLQSGIVIGEGRKKQIHGQVEQLLGKLVGEGWLKYGKCNGQLTLSARTEEERTEWLEANGAHRRGKSNSSRKASKVKPLDPSMFRLAPVGVVDDMDPAERRRREVYPEAYAELGA